MNYQIFIIKFTGKEESDALKWEDLVRELCNKIEFERDYRTNVSREDECYGEREHQGVFISGLVSAIYYLEIRKTDYW